jgi:hypothetical protein
MTGRLQTVVPGTNHQGQTELHSSLEQCSPLETIELFECNRGAMLPTLLPIAYRGMSNRAVRTSDVAVNRFDRHESSGCDRLLTSFDRAKIRFVRFCSRLRGRQYRVLTSRTGIANQEKAS